MKEILRCAHAFFVRDAQNALSYRFAFIYGQLTSIARTLLLWLPAQLVGDNPVFKEHGGFLAYSVTGSAMMGLFTASYGGFATAISSERGVGTLESVFATRAPLSGLLLGGSAWTIVQSLFEIALNLAAAAWIFDIELRGSALATLPIIILTNLTFVAFGFFSAAFTILFKRGDPFRLVVGAASALLGGVFYPADILPKYISWIGELLPITHGARALRGVVLQGQPLAMFAQELLILVMFCVVLFPLGVWAFYKSVRMAKLDGTLYQY